MNVCLWCGKEITNKPHNIFCNKSCAASFRNKSRKKVHYCKICNTIVKNPRNKDNIICLDCYKKSIKTDIIAKFNCGIYVSNKTIRKILINERDHRCEECGLDTWMDKLIPLDVHHIDGNFKNNKRSNLKLLCKNCHALTENYGSKNAGNGRPYIYHR